MINVSFYSPFDFIFFHTSGSHPTKEQTQGVHAYGIIIKQHLDSDVRDLKGMHRSKHRC